MSNCNKWFKWGKRVKKLYQPLKGFEEKTNPKRVEGFEKILQTIVDHCGEVEGKTFLDIGCNVGYFCFKLTDMGAKTIGLERDMRRNRLSRCVAKNEGYTPHNPLLLNVDAPSWVLTEKPEIDYVILLNTIHHLFVQDEGQTWEMFNWLIENSNGVFIMMRGSLKGWKLCEKRESIPEAMISKSSATNYVEYPPVHRRKIYFFSK
jgi:hypothetical protein